ncbi:hypothetical protein PAMP_006550 [Pampus punctatissimus]
MTPSTAFNTISYSIFLNRPSASLTPPSPGSHHTHLKDFITSPSITTNPTPPLSHMQFLKAQFSVPILFILYMLPLDPWTSFPLLRRRYPALHHDQNHHSDIKSWMNYNFLKLNSNKAEIIIFGPKLHCALTFKPHINHVIKTSFFHLCDIARLFFLI